MKKPIIAAIALTLSASSFAWGPAEQAGLVGLILGGLAVNSVHEQKQNSPQQARPVLIQQAPIVYEPRVYEVIIEPNFVYRPPTYDVYTSLYTYTPPMVYDQRSLQWIHQSKIYIPADKHFAGCNFYNHTEAWDCINRNEAILRGTYVR